MSDKWYISGPLGIGTTPLSEKLEVAGNIVVNAPDSNIYSLQFARTDESGREHKWALWHMNSQYRKNALEIWEYKTDSTGKNCDGNPADGAMCTPRLMILEGGNVGIGTTNPGKKLHIEGSSSAPLLNDGYDRPGLAITGSYPELDLFSAADNPNHGPTIRMGGYNDNQKNTFKHWVIGTAGRNSTFLDIGFSDKSDPNPHAGIRDHNGKTCLTILDSGNVGIGTTSTKARLSIVGSDAKEIDGTAQSSAFRISAGTLPTSLGSELSLASIGFHSANNTSLGVRAHRFTNGSDWTTTAIGLGIDVDNTVRVNDASLWLHPGVIGQANSGRVGISISNPQAKLHVNGDTLITGNTTVGAGGNAALKVRHINGKGYTTPDPDGADALYLNYDNSKPVHIGGGATSDLHVHGDIHWSNDHSNEGYVRIGNLQIAWGRGNFSTRVAEIQIPVNFPNSFSPGLPIATTVSIDDPGYGQYTFRGAVGAYNVSANGFVVMYKKGDNFPKTEIHNINYSWIAIGPIA